MTERSVTDGRPGEPDRRSRAIVPAHRYVQSKYPLLESATTMEIQR